jgi:hypothetical protein
MPIRYAAPHFVQNIIVAEESPREALDIDTGRLMTCTWKLCALSVPRPAVHVPITG